MCFVVNESRSECHPNTLEFKNQLEPSRILKVNCKPNKNEIKVTEDIKFNDIYELEVDKRGKTFFQIIE